MIDKKNNSGIKNSEIKSSDAYYRSELVNYTSENSKKENFPILSQNAQNPALFEGSRHPFSEDLGGSNVQSLENSESVQLEESLDGSSERIEIEVRRNALNLDPIHLQDLQFLESWVTGKSKHTKRGYLRVALELLNELHPKTLKDATLQNLQLFMRLKSHRKDGTQMQQAAALKSLFSFAVKTGYLPANTAAFLPKMKTNSNLTERYLSEEEVMRMIALTEETRDQVILKVLYSGGLRVSELLGLNWEHLQPRENGTAQITVLGKGNKKRVVVISEGVYQGLLKLKGSSQVEGREPKITDPIFISREEGRGRLSERMVRVIIDRARLRAGILKKVSPHWLRHAHASHALDRGAPIHLVQATLGHASVATTGKYLHARPQESSSKYLGI